ncbi:MAG: DUF6232 family protein [Leptolyngbyaceae cyanobacterium bins.302]|nr:DUF6232 family protein [Leptolyngbyaceae cyanobacterium bins.302]
MTEETFLNHDLVQVTKTRFITPGETYAVNGIISVKTTQVAEEVPSPLKEKITTLVWSWVILGTLTAIAYTIHQEIVGTLIGIFLLLMSGGIFGLKTKVPKHAVTLRTSSGEVKALESDDVEFIQQVVKALNQAIIARG